MTTKLLSSIHRWYLLGIVGLGVVLYVPVLHGDFQFDDHPVIVHNKILRAANPVALFSSVKHPTRAVSYLTFWANYQWGGLDPFGYHCLNVLIHLLNALLVYGFVHLLMRTPRGTLEGRDLSPHLLAATAAALFVCHPLQTESVSYITQRFTSLATFFYLATLCLYLRGRLAGVTGARTALFIGAAVSAVLGMLTKQITLTLPLMVLFLEFGFFTRRTKAATAGLLLAAAVLSGVIPLLYHFNAPGILSITHENGNHPGDVVTSATYAMTQPRVVLTYLRLLAVPFGQTLLYDFPLTKGWADPSTMASLLLLLMLLGVAVAAWRRARILSMGIIWFFLTLTVEATVIPIRHVIFEHRTYLPSVGIFIVAAWALQRVISHRQARIAVLVAVLVVLSALTIQRNRVWQSGVAMWTDVAAKSPANARVFYNLGYEYLKAGDKSAALANFSKALLIDPDDELALINRSQLLLDGGEGQRALHDINNALRLNPRRADNYLNRGAILRVLGRFHEALEDFEQAQTLDPEHRLAAVNRALTLGNLGRFSAGLKVINDTITRHGESAKALAVRGALQMGLRDSAGAVESFSRGIALDPGDEELHRNRAQAWQVLGRFDRSLEDLTFLIEKDPRQPDYYTQRAYVLTRLNRLNDALADYALAGRRAPELAQVYLERGKIYYKQGAYGQAAAELDLYLNRSPGAADAFMLRGLTHYELRDFQQALADFQRARDLGYSVDDAYFQQLKRVLGKI